MDLDQSLMPSAGLRCISAKSAGVQQGGDEQHRIGACPPRDLDVLDVQEEVLFRRTKARQRLP